MNKKISRFIHSERYKKVENASFILILLMFPLLLIQYGIDYTDTGYAITNFQSFGYSAGKMSIATFLSNALGAFFMQLPMGKTYLGIVAYTSLFIGVLTVVYYLSLRNYFSPRLVFIGCFFALCARWCPSVVLYNYLTYFLYGLAIVFILRGFKFDKKYNYYMAGFILGLNVFVRFPNITHCILILPVIFYFIMDKKSGREIAKNLLLCVMGWLSAFLLLLGLVTIIYGPGAYVDMIQGLFADAGGNETYSPWVMLTGNFVEFWELRKWIIYITLFIFAGIVLYKFCVKKWIKVFLHLHI